MVLAAVTVTAAVELRSSVLREVWDLATGSLAAADGPAHERAPLEHVDDTLHVCARGLVELLAAPSSDRERCRRGCLQGATSVLRAFARATPVTEEARPPAARLARIVDDRLAAHERSVLSGEATYALDLDTLRQISAASSASVALFVGVGGGEGAGAWERLEQAVAGLLVIAVRAMANIDCVGLGVPPLVGAPTTVLDQLGVIVDQIEGGVRDLPAKPEPKGDRAGRLLGELLRVGVPARVLEDLTRVDAPVVSVGRALCQVRVLWLTLAARELEIVRMLDRELVSPSYGQLGSLHDTVTAGAANVLMGGRLLDRPGAFNLVNALIHQHDGLTHAVEFYTAALRGHHDAQTKTQLIVLTRLLRAVAVLWIIDARTAQLRGDGSFSADVPPPPVDVPAG